MGTGSSVSRANITNHSVTNGNLFEVDSELRHLPVEISQRRAHRKPKFYTGSDVTNFVCMQHRLYSLLVLFGIVVGEARSQRFQASSSSSV